MNIEQFLAMGGYAVYVWPCYALTAFVVALNIFWARRSLRLAKRAAQRRVSAAKTAAAS